MGSEVSAYQLKKANFMDIFPEKISIATGHPPSHCQRRHELSRQMAWPGVPSASRAAIDRHLAKPKVVFALGATALRGVLKVVTGKDEAMEAVRT